MADDPSDASRQHDKFAAFLRLGFIKETMGDKGAARGLYRKADELIRRLVSLDPSSARWRDDLAMIERRLADGPTLTSDLLTYPLGEMAVFNASILISSES